ncbi:MAG: phosphotransferase [Myxococcales bacterium]
MALRPWLPERAVDAAAAQALIEAQFPQLKPARVTPLGEGWDNTAFAVNDAWVFRFPRRQIAVPLIEREIVVLPQLSGRLPLPVPAPELIGAAVESFPWPFAGYRMLPGRTADQAGLTLAQRERAAAPLGRFLQALHALPIAAGRDAFDRLQAAKMRRHTAPRLRELGLPEPGFFDDPVRAPLSGVLVHGDLHARQVLVDGEGSVCGVIDWGDVHSGDPACDLAIAWTLLPHPARPSFRQAYGAIDPETWALARLRGLHLCAALGVYAKHTSDEPLLREALAAFDFVRTS